MTEPMKEMLFCLICNIKFSTSTRNSIKIFDKSSVCDSQKSILSALNLVLETEVTAENVHSDVICKKCYKLFNEYDELTNRLAEIKHDIFETYRKTVKKLTEDVEEEYNDHDYVDHDSQDLEEFSPGVLDEDGDKPKDSFPKEEHVNIEYLHEDINQDEENVNEEYIDDPPEKPDIKHIVISTSAEAKTNDAIKKIKNLKYNGQEALVIRDKSTNLYTCLLCPDDDRIAGDAREIVAHLKASHDVRLYICDMCGAEFKKRNELSAHMDEHIAKEEGDFQCESCNRIFSNLRLFRIHKRVHYPQAKSWTCDQCGKKYSSKNLLEEHRNTHTGHRPYICKVCKKDFASKYTFKAHVKTHEIRPRPFECMQCNKTFLSQQNLTQHERTHLGIKEFVCQHCGKAFGSQHNLEVHNIVHTGHKPYVCDHCGKAFARKAEIRDHERTHTGEKPYQCEFCGATFSQRSNLQSHKRATHYNDKRYKCDDCGKGFKRRRLLDYHIKAQHTGERPFKCETCSATFVYPEHFKKHMRIHTGEKPYLCEVCGKAFNSRDNRNSHRFIHSDKKPYECLVCGMGFMRKPLLYTHMQNSGHLNDTIVVNQPRLTTTGDQVITIPEGTQLLINSEQEEDEMEETELYVTDMKDHVIIQEEDENIYEEEEAVLDIPSEANITSDQVDIVVNNQIAFADGEMIECKTEDPEEDSEMYSYNTDDGETIVVPANEYKNLISNNKGPVRLVQMRILSGAGGDGKSWLSLVQQDS
ncbi:zinc finger protein 723 [Microplitis demolitor]|uniref:zinc finger protein 723 n=1 Tax=Microplitis demolitor TaxID=69319 RepID=UPI00044000D6|nr:zinc finger protein 723 [Microplitis demolitor]XP_008553035.1 zinc finger protein 723 [Microplitis demolitor]